MKKIFMIGLTILLCPIEILMATNSNYIKTSLSGKITDKQSGEALTGVLIYIPDLKTGTISDSAGTYRIDNLPRTNVLVQLSLIGYKKIIQMIDLSKTSSANFVMEPSIVEMNEVVVTGLSKAAQQNRMPAPISTVPRQSLLQNSSTNIIDALAHQPGMS
ncbi:MAG: carboxypeptidase-like regulatory domain-containing protein, partial [Bacteroidota bacterium]|nr:carboxypeptidase-like regulatory domain-containing protein [Bacteroidota bacterium]